MVLGRGVIELMWRGRWRDVDDIIDLDVPYPDGADWTMHHERGVYEGLIFG